MEFENYLNDRSLDNADAAGDQAKMNQMSQAITSLMNVRLQDDYENEIEIDYNNTGKTSTSRFSRPVGFPSISSPVSRCFMVSNGSGLLVAASYDNVLI